MDIRAALMCGIDFPIPECQLVIHQPSIREIAFIGERDFLVGAQTIGLNKSMFVQDKTHLDEITNFQIFMTIMRNPDTKEQKDCVLKIFQLCFPTYKTTLTYNINVEQDCNINFQKNHREDIRTSPKKKASVRKRMRLCLTQSDFRGSEANLRKNSILIIMSEQTQGFDRCLKVQHGADTLTVRIKRIVQIGRFH